ncbi:hypothetical protein ACFL1X_02365 [Candidatus Hydrogenedentota bacterium]
MKDVILVKIKQQPFAPPFVVEVDGEPSTRVSKLDDAHVVAHIDGRGAYKIDISDVGFFSVEKEAVFCEGMGVPEEGQKGSLARIFRATSRTLGEHCGDVLTEFRLVRDALLPRGMTNK